MLATMIVLQHLAAAEVEAVVQNLLHTEQVVVVEPTEQVVIPVDQQVQTLLVFQTVWEHQDKVTPVVQVTINQVVLAVWVVQEQLVRSAEVE